MAYLALVWRVVGYSIPATRLSMLALAAAAVVFTFLLGRQLSDHAFHAILAVVFLLLDPLFYTQSMMAQLDMPAMLFTVLGLLLFLTDRHVAAAVACTALVLSKETGALLPLIFIVALCPRSGSLQVRGVLSGALRRSRHLVLRALAHHRPHLRRSGLHAIQHYLLAESGPRLGLRCCDASSISLLTTSAGWARSRSSSPGSASSIYSTRALEDRLEFHRRPYGLWSACSAALRSNAICFPFFRFVYIAMGAAFQLMRPRWRYVGVAVLAAGWSRASS